MGGGEGVTSAVTSPDRVPPLPVCVTSASPHPLPISINSQHPPPSSAALATVYYHRCDAVLWSHLHFILL